MRNKSLETIDRGTKKREDNRIREKEMHSEEQVPKLRREDQDDDGNDEKSLQGAEERMARRRRKKLARGDE